MSARPSSSQLGGWGHVRLAWRLYRDPRVSPRLKKFVPALGLLYLLSPIDLVPDFFLGLGQLDDLGVMGLIAAASLLLPRFTPASILAEHLRAMGVLRDETNLREEPRNSAGSRPSDVIDARFHVRG